MRKRIIRSRTQRKMKKAETRERKVLISVRSIFPQDPYVYLGYYSWLPGVTGEPLQLDIFFPEIGDIGRKPLAIEVQGDQHRGTWRRSLKHFFRSSEEFERQKENDDIKRATLETRNITLLEVWPEDDITPGSLREKIEKVTGVKLHA